MLRMRHWLLAAAAAAAASISASAGAATIIDENFESGFGAFSATGAANINTGTDYIGCCGTHGSAGAMSNHFVDFGSGDRPSGLISAPFELLGGSTYELTFDFGALGAGTEDLFVTLAGFTFTFPVTANDDMDATFHQATITLTNVPGSMTALEFHSSGVANIDSIIDNVLLTGPVRDAVPEPATWAMMLLGFAGIGAAMRKRRPSRLAQLA